MSDSQYRHFQRGETPAQFFLQVEEGMARFDVPDAANLTTLLEYSRTNGYQVVWTDKVRQEEVGDLEEFPGGRYVAHRLPETVLDPNWIPPAPPEGASN